MSEHIIFTKTEAEVAIDHTTDFLQQERGTDIDGDFAAQQVETYVTSVAEQAERFLGSMPFPGRDGWYVPLSKHNADQFAQAAMVLPGHLVLVPSVLVEKGASEFFPAVVSEDSLSHSQPNLRLHVLRQPYRADISYGAGVVLSAAAQSETKGVGDHGRTSSDGVEAEHFATLLALGTDPDLQTAWLSGNHINHAWRSKPNRSVMAEMNQRLFDKTIPQATITITQEQIAQGRAILLWHEGMRDSTTGRPESGTHNNALVIAQSLGFEALKQRSPDGVDTIKRLIA